MLLYVNHTISYENFHLTNLIIIKLNSKFLEKNFLEKFFRKKFKFIYIISIYVKLIFHYNKKGKFSIYLIFD